MKKKAAFVLLALVALVATVSSQDQDRLYVRELLRLMEREGWNTSETGELERLMLQHRWQWQVEPEPEPVALALGYARRNGLAGDPQAATEMALELSARAAEMTQLGFQARTVARAELEAVRATVRAIKDGGAAAPGTQIRDRDRDRLQTSELLRDQLREQIRLHEAEMLRARTGAGAAADQPGPGPGAGSGDPAGPGPGRRP